MYLKPILIATCCVIAIVIGAYLVGSLYFDQSGEDDTPAGLTDKPGPTAKKHWHEDDTHEASKAESTTQNTIDPSLLTLSGPPVDALRTQMEKLGHWSAEFIPPFPPDDLEAAAIAEAMFIAVADSIKNGWEGYPSSPEVKAAYQFLKERREATLAEMQSTGVTPRLNDLTKLTLPLTKWTTADTVRNWRSSFDNQ